MNTASDLQRFNELFAENTRLKAENERLQDSISRLCMDWAHEHTHLQNLCIAAGYTVQEVTECDPMLMIQDLADLLAKKIPQ
jgi:regulator of replication initiation timing